LTNSLTGIGEALLDSVPIVGLVTDVDRRHGAPSFQVHSTPNAPVLRPLCKAVLEVKHPAQIPFLIHDAFRIARSAAPAPLAGGWGYGPQGTRAAEKAFKEVDVVLAVGVKYSENSTASYSIPRHDRLIHVDACPNNIGRNVPACVGVVADSRVFLARLIQD